MTGVHPKRLKSAIPRERAQTCSTVYTQRPQPNEAGGVQVQKNAESTERWAWTTVGSILILWLLNPAIKSPDGLEMLRLTQMWLGQPTLVGDPNFWPPLWSALNIPGVASGEPVIAAHLLNQLLWGAVIWPLHLMTCCLADRSAANRCIILYLTLPMLISFGAVLDARPLGTLITTAFVAAIVHQATRGTGLWVMLFLAALAPFARPEGVLFPILAGAAAWLLGQSPIRSLALAGLALVPNILFRSNFRGMTGHEQLFGPWYGTWATWDMLSLFGPAAAPTTFREFALQAVDLGVVDGRPELSDFVGALIMVPSGILGAILIVAGAIGIIGMVMAGRGLWRVLPNKKRWWTLGLALFTPVVIGAAPMSKDQAGPLANYLFLMPGIIALVSVGIGLVPKTWPRWVPMGLTVLILAEAHHTPLQSPTPYLLEGSDAAKLATVMLKDSRPRNGLVAVDFSGRDVVLEAGLTPKPLGPPWLGPIEANVNAVLVNSVGASGEDGGRTLELLESTEWRVDWVVADEDIAMAHPSAEHIPELRRWDRGWYALLVRR